MSDIRVRFAPSPTGPLHIGGVRTALYNYLFARKHNGKMVLRIEDTDQNRFVPGAEGYILQALQWLGITIDEGVVEGGPYAPYRQSERKNLYLEYAHKMIAAGHAYYAFDTPAEIEAMREKLKQEKSANQQYNSTTRNSMNNALTLSQEEVQERLDSGQPFVIRLKVPANQEISLQDLVREKVSVNTDTIDDKILIKSDGLPTYHLANVVDDHLMKISHVIRGEEWLPSAPLHVLLYRFLGWEDSMPQFAHLPLLLKPDGNGKLSKRDSEKHGFPIFPLAYQDPESGEQLMGFKDQGYLKEAVVNFLALLGWNPGTEQEMFDQESLIAAFSLDRISKSGAKFDINKARWFNQEYLKLKPNQELAGELIKLLADQQVTISEEIAMKICQNMKERITFMHDIWQEGRFFFARPSDYDQKIVKKRWNNDAVSFVKLYKEKLGHNHELTAEDARIKLEQVLQSTGLKMGQVMQALRLALTGQGGGPDLMEIIEILGMEETTARIEIALNKLEVKA
ncbi:MAG: glutamate--tRNA ligase [Candidatus Cyclobacteriaceae bacterium M3_2C_046]